MADRFDGRRATVVSRRTVLGGLLVGGGGLLGLQGTGAVSAIIGRRPLDIGTADDHSAILGIDVGSPAGGDGETFAILTLTNRLNEPLTEVDVVVLGSGNSNVGLDVTQTPTSIQPGQSGNVYATLECDSSAANVPVEVQISVASASESITATREVHVSCDAGHDGPPAGDVYQIDGEPHWLDDLEYIFEIVHDDVWEVEWDFGDGSTSTQHYVRHTYAQEGTYDVTITVVIDGEEYVYTETLEVAEEGPSQDGPPAEEVYDVRQEDWLPNDRDYIFQVVHNNVWNVEWNFGDGSTSTNHYVQHTYAQDGTYDITIEVEIGGTWHVYTDTVVVST